MCAKIESINQIRFTFFDGHSRLFKNKETLINAIKESQKRAIKYNQIIEEKLVEAKKQLEEVESDLKIALAFEEK